MRTSNGHWFLYCDMTLDGRCFYVGKGRWHRACKCLKRNKKHTLIAEQHGQVREVLWWGDDEKWILKLEKEMIALLKLNCRKHPDNELACNFTDGG